MEESNNNHWRTAGLILMGAIIGYLIGRFSYLAVYPEKTPGTSDKEIKVESVEEKKLIQEISIDDDPSLGSDAAPVIIVDFSDYECPFCRNFYANILPELKKDYINTGKVKYVFRDLPLNIHKSAIKAAMAANCAGDQGRYWEMHDKLFENQEIWANTENPVDSFKSYAIELRLNSVLFNECLDSDKHQEEILSDKKDGTEYGAYGTPTLYFNGQILRGGYSQNYELFQEFLEKEFGI